MEIRNTTIGIETHRIIVRQSLVSLRADRPKAVSLYDVPEQFFFSKPTSAVLLDLKPHLIVCDWTGIIFSGLKPCHSSPRV